MTLIIALLCRDSIVIGSESKATELVTGHMGLDPSFLVEKISQLGDRILWGGSGEVGFIDGVRDKLDAEYKGGQGKFTKAASETCGHIRKAVVDVAKTELAHMVIQDKDRNEARLKSMKFLFCGSSPDCLWIYEVLGDGTGTRYERTRGFHAIGAPRFSLMLRLDS